MQVMTKFKTTEVGLIPEDWFIAKLNEIMTIMGGGAFKSSDSQRHGIRWLKIANVGLNQLDWTEESYLPAHFAEEFSSFLLKEKDCVVALTRPILRNRLKIAWVRDSDAPSLLNQRVGRINAIKGNDIGFVYYLLQKDNVLSSLAQSMAGTDPPNLSTKSVYSIVSAVPSSPKEQRAIATALSDVDALINSLDRLIAKKRDIKHATVQQLLTGDTRLPGFKKKDGFKQTEIGLIPEDWIVSTLGDVMDFRNGVNADKDAYGSGVKFINVLEVITNSHLSASQIPGRISLPKVMIGAFAVQSGDILFNRTSETTQELGLASVYIGTTEEVVFGGFVIRGRTKNHSLHHNYAGFALRSPAVRSQIMAKGQGAVRANIGQSDLRKVAIPLPPVPEQASIAKTLSDMDTELMVLQQRRDKTILLKQGMMQELLTGRTRLV